MKPIMKAAGVALALAMAAPAVAGPPAPSANGEREVIVKRYPSLGWGNFSGMSPEGRQILREAMEPKDSPQDRQALQAARQRLLSLIAADRLDVAAIRKAQAAERELVTRQHERKQEALLAAYQKMSAADRKAFTEGMRSQEERMLEHMKRARERMEEMEKRMRERMKERETGAIVIEPLPTMTMPIAYTRPGR